MKQLLLLVAVCAMATTGCVGSNKFVRNNCGPACHVARSQAAPRPNVVRTACYDGQCPTGYEMNYAGALFHGLKPCSCDSACDCGDCCECTCGCPEDCCCECSCGCAEDCCCGDECCGDGCCGECCDCDNGGCGLIDRMRCRGGCGLGGGCGACSACGGRGCGLCQRVAGRLAAGGCCPHSGGYPASYNFTPGPQSGQTAYPYYTTRGPRDFLMCNPAPLGPY